MSFLKILYSSPRTKFKLILLSEISGFEFIEKPKNRNSIISNCHSMITIEFGDGDQRFLFENKAQATEFVSEFEYWLKTKQGIFIIHAKELPIETEKQENKEESPKSKKSLIESLISEIKDSQSEETMGDFVSSFEIIK